MIEQRASGILLPVFSLPSPYGIGDLGNAAFRFVDFLANSGQKYWQILPLHPTDSAKGNSPYSSNSSYAGNTLFISPDGLLKEGFICKEDLDMFPEKTSGKINYDLLKNCKERLFKKCFKKFSTSEKWQRDFKAFRSANLYWLEDYTLFIVLKSLHEEVDWGRWPVPLRDRNKQALQKVHTENAEKIKFVEFTQFLFYRQWESLRAYCREKGIQIIGDTPFYVDYDSVDVWSDPKNFKLDKDQKPLFIGGVPPDYFSATGQRWGNPVYHWENMKKDGFAWWIKRIKHHFDFFDLIRIDHFRGFVDYWEISAEEPTAINGTWQPSPGYEFFNLLKGELGSLKILAEDLGIITDEVRQFRDFFKFPGMKVFLFAFGEENFRQNAFLPENFIENCVAYTGTHDNNTIRGWYLKDASPLEKKNLCEYFNQELRENEISEKMIHAVMHSRANTVIIPMQDLLNLRASARMNTPGTLEGNWQWRMPKTAIKKALVQKLRNVTINSNRLING